MESKMKVEIWSDVMCPFCYIGKRHFESALEQFEDKKDIQIEWKSFLLDPDVPENVGNKNVYEYLAERKGLSVEQSKQMHERVVEMAKNAGLDYNFDIAVVANSFKAHRLIQLAKTKGLGDEAEELLFKSYFTEGKNIADEETLISLAEQIGLTKADLNEALLNQDFQFLVNKDVEEARAIGVSGVPFFVFDRKYAVSGAQPAESFLGALKQSVNEWKKSNASGLQNLSSGESCDVDGNCN